MTKVVTVAAKINHTATLELLPELIGDGVFSADFVAPWEARHPNDTTVRDCALLVRRDEEQKTKTKFAGKLMTIGTLVIMAGAGFVDAFHELALRFVDPLLCVPLICGIALWAGASWTKKSVKAARAYAQGYLDRVGEFSELSNFSPIMLGRMPLSQRVAIMRGHLLAKAAEEFAAEAEGGLTTAESSKCHKELEERHALALDFAAAESSLPKIQIAAKNGEHGSTALVAQAS